MPQGPNIHFQVHLRKNGKAYGEIEVSVDGITLMRAPNYPLTALAEQLIEWSRRVDDGPGCDSFIFRHPPELAGTFRIEPRPTAWQFTSMWERHRHKRLLPLDDFKQMAARFHEQLSLQSESANEDAPRVKLMTSRNWFPLDLAALLFFPIIMAAVSLLMGSLFPVLNWLRHPTASSWFWALGVATGTSVLGIVLLFFAKLPQYRAGIFLRVGCHHLPPAQQRLYRVSFWFIVPSIIVLLALLAAVHRFQ